jgi:hypothetical protein
MDVLGVYEKAASEDATKGNTNGGDFSAESAIIKEMCNVVWRSLEIT